jgi:hypothetical protein
MAIDSLLKSQNLAHLYNETRYSLNSRVNRRTRPALSNELVALKISLMEKWMPPETFYLHRRSNIHAIDYKSACTLTTNRDKIYNFRNKSCAFQ